MIGTSLNGSIMIEPSIIALSIFGGKWMQECPRARMPSA
jgi:hypothetical protein